MSRLAGSATIVGSGERSATISAVQMHGASLQIGDVSLKDVKVCCISAAPVTRIYVSCTCWTCVAPLFYCSSVAPLLLLCLSSSAPLLPLYCSSVAPQLLLCCTCIAQLLHLCCSSVLVVFHISCTSASSLLQAGHTLYILTHIVLHLHNSNPSWHIVCACSTN
jgi:hypothetical protein